MAPIRRYLRISKYSVLECRIYLENPADSRWLLDSRDPVLPRVFKRIRPLVLPKLREENERARAKKKSKPVKDVLVEDEFEVSIFLREAGARHSILTRQKSFNDGRGKIVSNSNKLTGESNESPIRIDDGLEEEARPHILEENDGDSQINLQDIPQTLPDVPEHGNASSPSPPADGGRRRRRRRTRVAGKEPSRDHSYQTGQNEPEVSLKTHTAAQDEKKLGAITTYEGFGIWGWILCLIIKRKGQRPKIASTTSESSNKALMEEWICTQAPQEYEEE